MKKLVLIFCLLIAQSFFSQMAVTDVGATAKLAASVRTATKSLEELNKTYKLLKEANDKIQKVNKAVLQANHLKNIINRQRDAINTANQILKIAKVKKIDLSGVNYNLEIIQGSINTVQALLRDGFFNMSDSERLARLDAEYEKAGHACGRIKSDFIRARFM